MSAVPVTTIVTPAADDTAGMACPVCGSAFAPEPSRPASVPLQRCRGCGLVSNRAAPRQRGGIRRARPDEGAVGRTADYLTALADRGVAGGRLLVHAPPRHPVLALARERGFTVVHQTASGPAPVLPDDMPQCDAALLLDGLCDAVDPLALLATVRARLRPDGVLLLAVPTLDSPAARLGGREWTGWRPGQRWYFDRQSIELLLTKAGIGNVWAESARRAGTVAGFAPLPLPATGLLVSGIRVEPRPRPLLSIIIPAYNEAGTFGTLMDDLLMRSLPGMDREIIVVESNSTDGTRELATRYAAHPEVSLLLEDRPRGKGHAVRAGLARARGDFILIQDADLEYDLGDYPALLSPLLAQTAAFVLGSRHSGTWKMRRFSTQPVLAGVCNLGHLGFTLLLNVLYRQRMTDPFTMFKVFRRDCLYGLDFECSRFDFDVELVSKLLRKGYRPREIPVAYSSRSFAEGKKVRLFADPLTWLKAGIKYRCTRLERPRVPGAERARSTTVAADR